MSQFAFGTGTMVVTQVNDAYGNVNATPTPYPLMALESASVDLSGEIKELIGQNSFAVAIARGKVKMMIKVKPARIFAAMWNSIFFGQTLTPGILANYTDSSGFTIPPVSVGGVTALTIGAGGTGYVTGDIIQLATGTSTVKSTAVVTAAAGVVTGLAVSNSGAYTVAPTAIGATVAVTGVGTGLTVTATVTPSALLFYAQNPANAFAQDLGVQYALTGTPLKRVVSAPAAGQYIVNPATGLYTFSAADAGLSVFVNAQYTGPSTVAQKQTVANLPMGFAPTFKSDMTVSYLGKLTTFSFPLCVANKMAMGFKNDDFAVPDFEFQAFDNGSGNVMSWSTSE